MVRYNRTQHLVGYVFDRGRFAVWEIRGPTAALTWSLRQLRRSPLDNKLLTVVMARPVKREYLSASVGFKV